MDLSADNQKQPISDDQELAKALAGVTEQANSMEFEETGAQNPTDETAPITNPAPATMSDSTAMPEPAVSTDQATIAPAPAVETNIDPELANVKQDALNELRPLIDKLDVEPEEKFNTYLLLIRSTDDKDLIAPANQAAKQITDETKKAQALLDIIKEIDFLSNPKQ